MIYSGLSKRLGSVAQLVRQGARFADIGTDHAYLPIFLLKQGIISEAVCSDINEGPLSSAKRNAVESGVSAKMSFYLSDGADALSGLGITDYAICGMGGELIADIVDRASEMKNEGVNIILQPMTKQGHLRRYLASSGYKITCESYCTDAGKNYVCMLAFYDGQVRDISDFEAEFGSENCEIVNISSQILYLKGKIRAFSKIADGKISGGDDASLELSLVRDAERRIEKIRKLLQP